jgi:cephalosporin-C deacetylase-like acetyl esterase
VRIPCALSILAYEYYQNFLAVLKYLRQGDASSTSGIQHKLRVLDLLSIIQELKPEFLLSMGRFDTEIQPLLLNILDQA